MTEGSDRPARLLIGAVVPAVIAGLALVPWLITGDELPDPMATRFGVDGASTASMPLVAQAALLALVCGTSALALVWIARRPGPDAAVQSSVAAFVGLLTSSLWLLTALANRGHDHWREVSFDLAPAGLALVAVLAIAAWTGRTAHRFAPARPLDPPADRLPLGPGERAAWIGGTRSMAFLVAGAVFVVVGTAIALSSQLFVGLVTVLCGAALLAMASVTITVSERGLHVRSGPFPWLRVRFPLGVVTSARAIDLRPARWGGWGYRGSVRLFRRAAWVLRAGSALELELVGGQRFAVTVDGADEAAAVLNGLLARRSHTTRRG